MRLIQFSASLAPTTVIVCTQPGEPFASQRFNAIKKACEHIGNMRIAEWFHGEIEQNPEAPGFWKMWNDILRSLGFRDGDYIVASEPYGQRLAQECNGRFMPFDIDRDVTFTQGRLVRTAPMVYFEHILPEFQPVLRQKVTFFGAESTGKTTLSKAMAKHFDAHWTFEWARPYLENTENVITDQSMTEIWKGQYALQDMSERFLLDKPFLFRDTDLYSTLGYWKFWSPETCPLGLEFDAFKTRSDLYLVTQSNIPFERDPLRYGGDTRQFDDQHWIDLCERYELNYKVIQSDNLGGRMDEAEGHIQELWDARVKPLTEYQRQYNP